MTREANIQAVGLSDIKTEDNTEHNSVDTMQASVYIEPRKQERM